MPISPDMMRRYPGGSIRSPEWQEIRAQVRARSGDRCEGSPAYPDCRVPNGEAHPITGSIVVLTVAHLKHDPERSALEELRHWCQRCHNRYDAAKRRLNAFATHLRRRNDLFAEDLGAIDR